MIIFRLGAETIILITNECIVINDYDEKASGTPTVFLLRSSMPRPMFSLSWSPERSSSEPCHLDTPNHNHNQNCRYGHCHNNDNWDKQVKTQIAGVTVIADINGFSWKHIRNLGIDQIRWGLHLSVFDFGKGCFNNSWLFIVQYFIFCHKFASFKVHCCFPHWWIPPLVSSHPRRQLSKVTFHIWSETTQGSQAFIWSETIQGGLLLRSYGIIIHCDYYLQDLQHPFQHDGSLPQWAYSEQHHLPWVGIDTNLIWTMDHHESWCLSIDLYSKWLWWLFRSDLSDLHKEVAPEILPKDLGWDSADQDCCGEPD